MTAHGIMFHHFYDQIHTKGQGAISQEEFDDMIQFIGIENILSADEWMRRALSRTIKDSDICLTFDDNLRCQFDIALPVLQHYNLTAFWFVYTSVLNGSSEKLEIYRWFRSEKFSTIDHFYKDFFKTVFEFDLHPDDYQKIRNFNPKEYLKNFCFYTDQDRLFRFTRDKVLGKKKYETIMDFMLINHQIDISRLHKILWMDESCLLKLKDTGHIIGLHSHTHPTQIKELTPEEQRIEYQYNYNHLCRILDQKPIAMSHPCNSYNGHTLALLSDMGIKIGFRANMAESAASIYEFPREDHTNILKKIRPQ